MKLEIKSLQKKDYKKAIDYAITGMHFNWYLDSKFLLRLYGRYFWYRELLLATQIIAAYADGDFVGVLLADMKEEDKKHRSFWKSLYVKAFDFLQHHLFKGGGETYEQTNRQLYAQYAERYTPDGEILFLAADPNRKIKGIGSLLLRTLEEREAGKRVFLYTDSACTYPFYEHRGFERACEKDILLHLGKKQVPLTCFLYSKAIPHRFNAD